MPVELHGKYYGINDLRDRYDINISYLYTLMKAMPCTVKSGRSYLLPEDCLPHFDKMIEKFLGDKRLTLLTAANKLGIGLEILEMATLHGLPCIESEGKKYIKKGALPALQKAVVAIRQEYGKVSKFKVKEFAEKALEFLAEEKAEDD